MHIINNLIVYYVVKGFIVLVVIYLFNPFRKTLLNRFFITILKQIRKFYEMADATNNVVAATTEIMAQGSVPAVKLPAMVPAAAVPVHHDEKPEKFNGLNFKK